MERQKEQIFADCRAEKKHEFQADYDRRSIQELNGILESQLREIDHTLAGDQLLGQDQLLLQEQLSEQNRDLREAHEKSLNEMEELKRSQRSTFDEFSRRRLIGDRDIILELTAKIQELQNEVYWTKIREISKMLNRYGVDNPTLPVNQCLSQLVRDPGGMLSRSIGMPSRRDGPPSILDTWYIGKLFLKFQQRLLQHLIRRS